MPSLELEPFHRNISEQDLFQNLAQMWKKLGRQPRFRDCRSPISKFSAHTYAARFGSWRQALGKFIELANATKASGKAIPAYLGDGVYASFDGYQIWLAVNHHENTVVALEPAVMAALCEYAANFWELRSR